MFLLQAVLTIHGDVYLQISIKVFHVKILIQKVIVLDCDSLSIKTKAGEAISPAVGSVGRLVPSTASKFY